MTAAKVMDIESRLPGCSGQTADAVSAYTQVKMEDASTLLKIPKSECPDIWMCLPKHTWPKSWSSMEDPVVPLGRNLYGHPLAGLSWERQFEKILLKYGWEKVSNWECLFVNREKRTILGRVCGRHQICWQNRKHRTDLENFHERRWPGEPLSFLDHVHLGCTQRECTLSNDVVTNCRDMFESRISAGAKEQLRTRASGKPDAKTISSWSYDMEGHAKNCVERC